MKREILDDKMFFLWIGVVLEFKIFRAFRLIDFSNKKNHEIYKESCPNDYETY